MDVAMELSFSESEADALRDEALRGEFVRVLGLPPAGYHLEVRRKICVISVLAAKDREPETVEAKVPVQEAGAGSTAMPPVVEDGDDAL